jgi:hypothetical protein
MSDTAATPLVLTNEPAAPNCAMRAVRFVTLDLLNPETPFLTFLRKLVVLIGFVPAVLALYILPLFVAYLALPGDNPVGWGFICGMASVCIIMVTGTVPYIAAHVTGRVPDWALCVVLYGTVAGGTLIAIANPYYPLCVWVAVYAIFATLCELPARNVYLALLVPFFALTAYNTSALLTGRTPLAVPDHLFNSFEGMIRDYIFEAIAILVTVVACILQTTQHRKLLAASDAANQLSRDAAELLRNYDTAGVSQLLEEYAQLKGADPALIASYTALVENLNQYRPHLPNWMVGSHGEEELSHVADDTVSERSTRSTRSTRSARSARSTQSRQSAQLHAPAPQDSLLPAIVDGFNVTAAPKSVTIAFGIVDFKVTGELSTAQRGTAVSAFSDNVHRLASATHCAVHSFVGDTVQLSWNATLRAVQPEVKAARFLCGLKAVVAGNHDISVAAAAMHGKATTQFAGTGSVQAIAISMPWRSTARALMAFAMTHRAWVVHHKMASVAAHACAFRAVEALELPGAKDASAMDTVLVHEVLAERDADDDDDEWMYVLHKDGTDEVSDALHACVAGEYGTAMSLLEGVDDAAATVQHLKRRAEAALLSPPPSFAHRSCCHSV